jgi:polyisoprenoid-binding protein YceI
MLNMKNGKLILFASAILLGSAFTTVKLINWKVKEGYKVKVVEVGGTLKGLKAYIWFDEDKPETSKITATIDAKSMDVGSESEKAKRIIDADKFPMIMFETTGISKIGPGKYNATANLTLKGITKQIKFPFKFDSQKPVDGAPKETFSGTFTISPKDFNVETDAAKHKLTIELLIPVTK